MSENIKDFATILYDENTNPSKDPYKHVTNQMSQELEQMYDEAAIKVIYALSAAIVFSAPIQTIVSSLQLSVIPHKNIYQTAQNRSKEVARLNTQLTIQEKRRIQLQISSGSTAKPYTAPVYQGYRQAIYNLYQQGFKAFFKGLKLRVAYTALNFYPFFLLGSIDYNKNLRGQDYFLLLLQQYCLHVICGTSTNMLQVAQNRFILQNNIPEMRVFRSFQVMAKKMYIRGEAYRGNIFHFFNSAVQIIYRYPVYLGMLGSLSGPDNQTLKKYYLVETLMYPLTTAYKRFICQSTVIPGMIPIRYESIRHAAKVIAFEEGIQGLWRGFGAYNLIIGIRLVMMKFICAFNSFDSQQ